MTFNEIFENGEYVVVSNHNYDCAQRKRKNQRRARLLEETILEKGFWYNKSTENIKNEMGNTKTITYFIVRLEDSKDEIFTGCTVNYDVKKFTENKKFLQPYCESQKQEFLKKRIIFPKDIFIFPDEVGEWVFDTRFKSTYHNKFRTNILASVGENSVSVGTCSPVGVSIKKVATNSIQESLDFLRTYNFPQGK